MRGFTSRNLTKHWDTGRAADLEGFVAAAGDSGGPRRVLVEGEVGVYQASTSEHGLVYEIGFQNDQGKQRWKRLGPDASIEDARRLRQQLTGQPDPAQTDGEAAAASQDAGAGDEDQQTTKPEPVAAGGREA